MKTVDLDRNRAKNFIENIAIPFIKEIDKVISKIN